MAETKHIGALAGQPVLSHFLTCLPDGVSTSLGAVDFRLEGRLKSIKIKKFNLYTNFNISEERPIFLYFNKIFMTFDSRSDGQGYLELIKMSQKLTIFL